MRRGFVAEAELARREGREYEPASVLLERIKKKREKETKTKQEKSQIASYKVRRSGESR